MPSTKTKHKLTKKDLWSLSDAIIRFALPGIIWYRDKAYSYPAQMTSKQWKKILNKIAIGFELYIRDNGTRDWTENEEKQVRKAFKLFFKYFDDLWN